jgi:Spy/CpxP family protein refolding chaperone
MDNMKKTIVILMALALVAPAALLAQPGSGAMDRQFGGQGGFGGGDCQMDGHPGFQGRHGGRGMKGDGMGMKGFLAFADEIELTDDQEKQLEALQLKFQMERIDRQAELKKARVELRSLMRDDDAAESAVLRQIDVVGDLRTDMQKMQFSHRNEMKAVLTEDQINKLEELRKERRSAHPQMRGQRFGHGSKGRP